MGNYTQQNNNNNKKNFKNFSFVDSRSLTWTNGKTLKLKNREKFSHRIKTRLETLLSIKNDF